MTLKNALAGAAVKTCIIYDPDGNQIVFAKDSTPITAQHVNG